MTTETKFWKKKYFTMLAGQSVSLITSGILQMSIIFYLTAKTNSAMVLSIATLMGFLPQAVIGPFAGTFVDRHSRKGVMIGADLMIAATGGFWQSFQCLWNCPYGSLCWSYLSEVSATLFILLRPAQLHRLWFRKTS